MKEKYRFEPKYNRKSDKLTILDNVLNDMFIMGTLTEEETSKIYNKFDRAKKKQIKIYFVIEEEK